jgi:prepilin-type processing-associated H-X9-DG protein
MYRAQPPKLIICPSDTYTYWASRPATNYGACIGPINLSHSCASTPDYSAYATLPGIPTLRPGAYRGMISLNDVIGAFGTFSGNNANGDAGNNSLQVSLGSGITDGTSNVIALGEMLPYQTREAASFRWMSALNANASTIAPINIKTDCFDINWSCNGPDGSTPCSPMWTSNQNYQLANGFKSMHPNGAYFCFCDGSVRFLTQDISHTTFQYLGCRNDGMPVVPPE